jgi:hypothetical protein
MDSESTIAGLEAKPNLIQLYLSRLSLAKPAKLNFFKTPSLEENDHRGERLGEMEETSLAACDIFLQG